MVRLLAFALNAGDRLEFGRGLSTDDEPDLWEHDYTGDILQWIDLGHPDESRIRKASNRKPPGAGGQLRRQCFGDLVEQAGQGPGTFRQSLGGRSGR